MSRLVLTAFLLICVAPAVLHACASIYVDVSLDPANVGSGVTEVSSSAYVDCVDYFGNPFSDTMQVQHWITRGDGSAVYTTPTLTVIHYRWHNHVVVGVPTGCYRAHAEGREGAIISVHQYAASGMVCMYQQPLGGGVEPQCDYTLNPESGEWVQNCYSPLILDLGSDGIQTSGRDRPVLFDLLGSGRPEWVTWTASGSEDAFLYLDRNVNQTIDGGEELFGTATPLANGSPAANGFDALSRYDGAEEHGNGDGRISAGDAVWGRLRLWIDRNHDGLADRSENYALAAFGVVSISLNYTRAGEAERFGIDAAGNHHFLRGSFVRRIHGREELGLIEDVYFHAVRR